MIKAKKLRRNRCWSTRSSIVEEVVAAATKGNNSSESQASIVADDAHMSRREYVLSVSLAAFAFYDVLLQHDHFLSLSVIPIYSFLVPRPIVAPH